MKAPFRALAPLLLLLVASACTQVFDATALGVPVTMAAPPGDLPAGKPFKVTVHSVHGFFGFVTLRQADLRKGLAAQLAGGDQIARLKIKTKSRFFDLLVTGLTLGILVPRSVTYEGVVIGR